MNSASLGLDEVASSYVELQLLGWLKSLLGYPADSSGLLLSGGSMANLVGLAVARTHAAPYDVRDQGVNVSDHPRLMYYMSSEGHSSLRKAIELLGLGSASLRIVPVKDDFTIEVDALREAIGDDRDAGRLPACIIATAGTVNTGAIDPLNELADIAQEEKPVDACRCSVRRIREDVSAIRTSRRRSRARRFTRLRFAQVAIRPV